MPFLAAFGDMLKEQPEIPEFNPINTQDELVKAAQANKGALGSIQELAKESDKFSQEQLMARLREIVPDADKLLKNISKNIDSQVRGEIPDDVSAAVSRDSASRAFAGGYSGSQRAGALRTRDLGLTSLDMTQRGMDNATRWLQVARSTLSAPQFDVTSMFISPEQQIKNTWMNTEASMNNQWMKNQQEAEGSMGTIWGNALNQADSFIQQIAVSAAGSLGGGGGGMGGAGAKAGGAGRTSYTFGGY